MSSNNWDAATVLEDLAEIVHRDETSLESLVHGIVYAIVAAKAHSDVSAKELSLEVNLALARTGLTPVVTVKIT